MTETKQCRDCGAEHPVDDFPITHRKGSRMGGGRCTYKSDIRSCYCRQCANYRKRVRAGTVEPKDLVIVPYFTNLAPLPAWLEPRI